jgi:hypothetical protein
LEQIVEYRSLSKWDEAFIGETRSKRHTVVNLDDLRQIVGQLDRWQQTAPGSLDAMKEVLGAVDTPSPALLGQSLIQTLHLLTAELDKQLAELPPETGERLRLYSHGMTSISKLIATGQEWAAIQQKNDLRSSPNVWPLPIAALPAR